MPEEDFVKRLIQLRLERNVSAREMSLSIGQNPGYINNIESGKALPSMEVFFYICDYLKITPQEFFNYKQATPILARNVIQGLSQLSTEQLQSIFCIITGLVKKI